VSARVRDSEWLSLRARVRERDFARDGSGPMLVLESDFMTVSVRVSVWG
jgi:hypothetical protein